MTQRGYNKKVNIRYSRLLVWAAVLTCVVSFFVTQGESFIKNCTIISAYIIAPESYIYKLNKPAEENQPIYEFIREEVKDTPSETPTQKNEEITPHQTETGISEEETDENLYTELKYSTEQPNPDTAGTIIEECFNSVGSLPKYIPFGSGYVQNLTNLTVTEVLNELNKPSALSLSAGSEPQVLLVHTHTTESYEYFDMGLYDKEYTGRTTDPRYNMIRIGKEFEDVLKSAGIGVIHDKTVHDYPSYNGAYERSAETIKKYLEEYPSIQVVIDLHRDAIERKGGLRIKPTTEIDGKKAAQVMIIAGCDNGSFNMPTWRDNLRFAAAWESSMGKLYPTLARPVCFDYRKYNQDLTAASLLLEVGGHANTLEEAIYAARLSAEALSDILLNAVGIGKK